MISLALRSDYDVGVVFSQDQDLSEAVSEIRGIAKSQNRSVEMFSAFPVSRKTRNPHPIRGTTPIEIDRPLYDACLDRSNYRPR
ncbi:hypothetical protein [Paludisphaera rhizosphaerae]|uniref:hypothetical protein n=1 Tax=Paludisphaera rhizosphaerae TaxID=2711216 RepID=UPI00389964FF